ncbi:MAG: efflux RND transporter permease subunit [candidate division Zixibacteria bacterium]|jgi:HAE1 family hydrophobic/amphiphilic exporter-1|nr:efflux RND transporter permease subunit [candidate division Zixibacteria bacterium]
MFLSDISIKRPIMMSMLLIVFMLFGALAFFGMPLDLMPDIEIPYIAVQTAYSGAGPKDIEIQITKKVEDAVSSVSQIDQVSSWSMEGFSMVLVQFEMGKDVNIAKQEVKDKIDAVMDEFPDDAERPTVEKIDLQEMPVVEIILSGDLPATELWDLADKKIKDRLAQIEGVARAEISGGQERELQVILDDRVVFQNNISLSQLSEILGAQNLDMPGGHFEKQTQEYTVRLSGEFGSVEELANLEIPTSFGIKRLKDIATVVDAGAEVRERTSFYNRLENISDPTVVLISLVKTSEGNTVEVARSAYELLPELEASLPAGCKLDVIIDRSTFIDSTVDDTITNIILGILLTGLVLFLFLHDVRSTIIVALAMPTSILSAFMLMSMMDYTKNAVTLMALSTSVGILVTNSVVVIENIFRHKTMGKNKKEAASVGTSQTVVAVLASTATNIAVFLPIANMSGILGQIFEAYALTVTFATLFSLLVSFTLTPMLAALILADNGNRRRATGDWFESMNRKWEQGYRRLLSVILGNRRLSLTVIVTAVLLLVGTFLISGNVGFEFVPTMDEGDIRIEAELPIGYSLDETADALMHIEERLKEYPSVKFVVTELGAVSRVSEGSNMAAMSVKLVDVAERDLTTDETANLLIQDLSDIPNIQLRISATSSMGMSGQAPIQFNLQGQDMAVLETYKEEILSRIKDIPGLVNLNTSSRSGKPEISIVPDRTKLADAGLTVYDIGMQLRGALTGLVATQYRDQGEEYDVRVMISDASMDTPEEVANLPVTSQGTVYTLAQLADVQYTGGVSTILHIDKYKTIQFSGYPTAGVPLGDITSEIDRRVADLSLMPGYKTEWAGSAELMNEAIVDMLTALILAVVLTYMLLAAILESLRQPLLVLGTFPLALIGVIGAMVLTGATMNIFAMMAVIMLLGIVVNNAILILDYANELMRDHGMSVTEALLEACPVKLRPIIMSSVAIMLGMLPMALGIGASGREIRQPMGIVTIGGLLVSTILTLVVIPTLVNLTSKSKEPAAAVQTVDGSR